MEASGYFVAAAAEFTSGMKDSEYNLNGRYALLMMYTDRYSSSVVPYGNCIVRVDSYVYLRAETAKGLVNGVVNYLVDEMMKAFGRS